MGKGPNEVQVADLNGDGIPDIVAANYGSDTVSVLLGNGNGTFQPAQSFAAGSGPASVAVADLNGDGKLDLVVGNRNDSTVSVLSGNGNGTFQAPVTLRRGQEPLLGGRGRLDRRRQSRRRHDQRAQQHGDGAARQWRRHLRAGADHLGWSGADLRGRGRLERRRPARPGDRPIPTATR